MASGRSEGNLINIHELVEQQVLKTPDSIAIQDENTFMTYRELWEKSGKVANAIRGKGILLGEVVGIITGRCKELVISILGVLRAGGVFLLIDKGAPVNRISYMLEDSSTKLLLVKDYREELPGNEDILQLRVCDILLGEYSVSYQTSFRSSEDMVYILYTSGSTGKPKGVQILHRGLTNYITWAAEYYCGNELLNFPLYSAVGFDLTITSIFTPLLTGAKIIVFESDEIDLVRQVVKHEEVHIVKLTPTHLNMLSEEDVKASSVRKFVLGGEALKTSAAKRISDWYRGKIEIYNEYGPTEATVGCMIYRFDPQKDKREVVPIGLPIKNTRIYILDKDMKQVAYGVTGEIYIGGQGLARGYLNKDEQTKRCFVENPYISGSIIYKTGDLAKVIPGKIIEYLGRKDEQVKLRGFRIELGEIENVLLKQEGVKEAAVVIRGDNENGSLCAFITAYEQIDITAIKHTLKETLPVYMVPDRIELLEAMPVTSNGKADKGLLRNKCISLSEKTYVLPANDIEKKLVLIWKELLNTERIGVNDNFFDLGGNSMRIVQLSARIAEELQIECKVSELFAYPTISEFVRYKFNNEYGFNKKEAVCERKVSNDKDIAIIGIGITMPLADSLEELWELLAKGHDFIGDFPNQRKSQVSSYINETCSEDEEYLAGAYLENIDFFDAEFFDFSPKEADLMDPSQRIFLQTCWKSIEDAGYSGKSLYGSNTGVFLGYGSNESEYRRMAYKYNRESINTALTGTLPSIIASRISYMLNFTGPAVNFDTACSSSLTALHYACQSLYLRECEQAIVGGIKIQLLPLSYNIDIGISSKDNKTRTFDNQADGTVGGEGSIAMFLKPLKGAVESKDRIYAVIKGSALNQDGRSNGITAPNPVAQADVIVKAWENAGINPETVSMLEAHGTGTKLGDPIEIDGITRAFRRYTDKKQICAIGTIKSNMGHLDNAAGLAGILKAALCLKHKKLIPSIHFEYPNEEIDFINSPVYVNTQYRDWIVEKDMPRRCGVSSFGMSGTNSHIVLEEAPVTEDKCFDNARYSILTVSAKSRYSFKRLLTEYTRILQTVEDFEELRKICYTSNTGRGHYRYRLAVIFKKDDKGYCINLNNYKQGVDCRTMFYGEHVIIAPTKKIAEEYEITKEELNNMKEKAAGYTKELSNGQKDNTEILRELILLYVRGCEIEWNSFLPALPKVSLPVYPFKKERHWLNVPRKIGYYKEEWVENGRIENNTLQNHTGEKLKVAVIMYDNESCNKIVDSQLSKNYSVIPVYINYPKSAAEDIETVILKQIMKIEWSSIHRIIHIGCLSDNNFNDVKMLQSYLLENIVSLVCTIRAASTVADPIPLIVFSKQADAAENSVILSVLKTISTEYPGMDCFGYDVDDTDNLAFILENIQGAEKENPITLIRKDRYYKSVITKYNPDKKAIHQSNGICNKGIYIIWGGTGNIGRKLAEFLTEAAEDVHIILAGRRCICGKEQQKDYTKLEKLIKENNEIEVFKADISDEKDVISLLDSVKKKYGKINGMFLCAAEGVGGSAQPVRTLEGNQFWDGTKAKIAGLFLLEKVWDENKLDFMVLFSSAITSTGSYGASAYAAANAYLDSYASKESKIAKRVITINWPSWISTINIKTTKNMQYSQMFLPIDDKDALENLSAILKSGLKGRFIIGEISSNPLIVENLHKAKLKFSDEILKELGQGNHKAFKTEQPVSVRLEGKKDSNYTDVEHVLGKIIGNILGYETINVYHEFGDMGMNSILFVQVQLKLEADNIYIGEKDFYTYNTVHDLAAFIEGKKIKHKTLMKKVQDEKIFNDIFYKSCFYNSLFSLLRLNDKDLHPFYVNDMFIYKYKNGILDIETVSKKNEDTLLAGQGVKFKKISAITSNAIIEELAQNRQIIAWVDSYYEAIRMDTYNKQHLAHTLAIVDYKKEEELFIVIEHTGKDNLDYKQCLLSKSDMDNCLEGFTKHFSQENIFYNYILEFDSGYIMEEVEADYKAEYQALWSENLSEYEKSVSYLTDFVGDIRNKKALENNEFSNLINMIRNIVNFKALDVFRNKIMEKEDESAEITGQVYEAWKKLRNSFIRLEVSGEVNDLVIKKLISEVNNIRNMEMQLLFRMRSNTETEVQEG
ncbi:amino acid adenylation domain-containing protein [Anaerocolumna xylanovorans]|uniref:Polyketide synthase PksJ n=1 Tax=Anaerocolumna xylanovorans DSM 12503 TaxID=1121345 RepID=A0A1M7YMI2_9FIRM|nr:amino acid adenylation domain-containing protein [Anaerocolumna xylanovorans]SHO53820.1 polyketide synthase PksJ [Anaerocolumna xylanovorans DSM 12503]